MSHRTTLERQLRRPAGVRALLLVVVVGSLGIASCGDNPGTDLVIATVGDRQITRTELVGELERRHGPITLLDMIDDMLIREEAKRRNISVSKEERLGAYDRAAARVGSMKDLEQKLRASGTTKEAYQQELETDLLMARIARQIVQITDAEVGAYYAHHLDEFQRGPRVKARMMLFLDEASARSVREVLDDPAADFAGLAKSLSEDAATGPEGGDMGYFERDDYASSITDAAFALKPGALSGVIKAPDGWVLLQVEDKKPAGPMGIDEVGGQIRQRLVREKQQGAKEKWLREARAGADLVIPSKELRAAVMQRLDYVKPPPMPGQL